MCAEEKRNVRKGYQLAVEYLAVDPVRLNQANPSIPIVSIPIAIIDKVPGSGTDGVDEVSVLICAAKDDVIVPPPATIASADWKLSVGS